MQQMAQALDYMHGKGVLHCNLKPSNVLLDDQGQVRLVDFGQARSLGDQGNSFGTLGYMAPEQAAGNRAGRALGRLRVGSDRLPAAHRSVPHFSAEIANH